MRKFRPLESKTPCTKCNVGCKVEGITIIACKDYKEIESSFGRLNTAINNLKKAIYNSLPAWLRGKK